MAKEPGLPGQASSRMLEMLNAFLTVQALHAAAALGIADRLAEGPATVEDLAAGMGAYQPSLYRLLHMLTGAGVFRDWALFVGARETWEAWGRLRETVLTGGPGFVLSHGMSVYEHLPRHPEL